ncbi:hypothetical protein SMICM304S_06677 [Streptomyces microflavus]
MLGGEKGQLTAERLRAVDGDERLVAAVGVGAERALPAVRTGGDEQRVDRRRPEERKIGGEDEHPLRRRQPHPRSERGQRAAALRDFAGPGDRP